MTAAEYAEGAEGAEGAEYAKYVRKEVLLMGRAKTVSAKGLSRTRSIAFVALAIAIMAVSAWVTVPIGPVPFTLQMFALVFAIVVLSPRECIVAVAGYLLLGAVGLPVFAGMRGGIGVLAGPTGGFLWGYLFGAAAASLLLWALRDRVVKGKGVVAVELAAGVLFTAISYVCGWAQFMPVMGVGPEAAFVTAIAPFIFIDAAKIVAAVMCARAVKAVVK